MDSLQQSIMNKHCRICAEKDTKLIPLLGEKYLMLKIHKCLPIEIKVNDHLSVNICEMCRMKIDESYLLYETCYYADLKLRQLWKTLYEQAAACANAFAELTSVDHLQSEENEVFHVKEKEAGSILIINEIPQVNKNLEVLGSRENLLSTGFLIKLQNEEVYDNQVIVNSTEECKTMRPKDGTVFIMNERVIEVQNPSDHSLVLGKSKPEELLPDANHNPEPELEKPCKKAEEFYKKNKNDAIGKQYQCKLCSKVLSTLASLSVHESTHLKEKLFLCDICGNAFKHASNLRSHVRTHLGIQRRYTCQVCQKSFVTNFFLQEHMHSHTGETPYKCSICGKEFREKVHLRQHKWTHSTDKFECSLCGAKFNRKGNMSAHIKKYHKNDKEGLSRNKIPAERVEKEKSKRQPFSCPVCSETFHDRSRFKMHVKTHSDSKCFYCPICGKKFRHSGSLTYHRRTAHTGEKPFQCSYCEEKFSLRSVQKIHERKKHTFECPYKCSICSSVFTNSSSLKNHSYVHVKEKPFECNECGKKFTRRSNLAVHKKLHSGERQYICEHCGKSYIQKHDMLKHKKIHDPKRKPFFCKYCGYSFSDKKDFSKHTLCQINYTKRSIESCTTEKILDSVTNALEKEGNLFEAEQLILESVEQLSGEKLSCNLEEEGHSYINDGVIIHEIFTVKGKDIRPSASYHT